VTVVLLDLNYTLVANSGRHLYNQPFEQVLAQEEYRGWLARALVERGDYVCLVTVREEAHRQATLERIAAKLDGWQPDEAHFKPANHFYMKAPDYKQHVLHTSIYPEHGWLGATPREYLAIESNERTQAMYRTEGIRAIRADDFKAELEAAQGALL
jgi:hypothetical protein